MSNAVCPARRLTEADAAQVCALMQGNPLFYRYHPPQPTPESIRTDMTALPPGKAMEDKWFVGFYDGDCLIAVMDLILNYPAADTAFIGLFMTAHDRQGCGLGSRILRDCMARLSAAGYHRLRLAVDEGNPQSLAFWTAMVLLMVFAVYFKWFPIGLSVPIGVTAEEIALGDRIRHAVLPAAALSLTGISSVALHTREKMVSIMESDFVLFARARGESETSIVLRHGLRNVLIPAMTLQFASISEIIGGSVLVEQVFSYPGLGQAAVTAGLGSDVPLLLGITVVTAVLAASGNLAASVLYGIVDPRIRKGAAR